MREALAAKREDVDQAAVVLGDVDDVVRVDVEDRGADELVAQMDISVPARSNTCTRSFSRSHTSTRPDRSIHTPCGSMNCPGALPGSPHDRRCVPSAANLCTRALP